MSDERKLEVTEDLQREATKFGYIGMISHRDNRDIALHELITVVENYEDKVATKLALAVALNTLALERAREARVIAELREMTRGAQSYIRQDSRSTRRRGAMLKGAKDVLAAAEREFGPE